MEFTFGMDIIDRIIREIKEAEKYVTIAVFQIHNDNIYDSLEEALNRNIKVMVFTLPYDSINRDIRDRVTNRIEKLKNNGADVCFSKWGIGDPERTTTAVGRWYSFHGKFIVTDKSAIAISANLTEESELDAMLVYRDQEKINEFNDKFTMLKQLFIEDKIREDIENSEYIKQLIESPKNKNPYDTFEAPRTITEDDVRQHWIKDYPAEICHDIKNIENKMYIAPFDVKARELYEKAINEAEEYVYVSTESFTDTDMIPFLISNSVKNKNIKILTGSESQDFTDRIRELYPRLLANGIELRKPGEPLHGKLLITDKLLIISSVNLNKMNLGYARTKKLWRSNTETITVENNKNIIIDAKNSFEKKFSESKNLLDYLAENTQELIYAKSIFTVFGVKPDNNVKFLLSKVIIKSDIKLKHNLYNIGRYAYIIVNKYKNGKKIVETEDFLSSMILYYLSDRKHTESELKEEINGLTDFIEVESIINQLVNYKLIVKEEGFYKLDLNKLLGD